MSATQATTTVRGAVNGLSANSDPAVTGAAESASTAAPSPGDALAGAAGTLGQADSLFTWSGYFQVLALLFLIVAALFVTLWFIKRKGGIKLLTKQGDLFFESRLALGPKKYLVVVRFLNKRVLLGVTDQQITMLTELPTDEDDTAHTGPDQENTADFKAHLLRAGKGGTEEPG